MAFWDASITIPVSSIPTQSSHKNINKGGGISFRYSWKLVLKIMIQKEDG